MNLRQVAVIAACAAVAAGAVGCGGGDDSSDTTATETLTKQEWIEQADQICSAGDDAIQQAAQDAGLSNNSTPEELKSFYTETVLPNIEDQRDQIEALPVPAGEEDAIGGITDALDQAISDSQADPDALVNGEDLFKDVNQQAQDYGLTSCGDGAG